SNRGSSHLRSAIPPSEAKPPSSRTSRTPSRYRPGPSIRLAAPPQEQTADLLELGDPQQFRDRHIDDAAGSEGHSQGDDLPDQPAPEGLVENVPDHPADRRQRGGGDGDPQGRREDRKSTRLNSSHVAISYAV